MSKFQNDSIFWIEVDKIKPNPYQPRREFSEEKLSYLADSIRQYGILQPLVVTRHEVEKPDGGLMSEYELIAGERRLRASKKAGLVQVPVIIRTAEESDVEKLELAIIENLQREDLNPIDRALAFQKLVEEFHFKHIEIAKKMGKSREYVTNSLRLLTLPEEMRKSLSAGQITEGHARPILMLKDRPEEQITLFKEIIHKKLTVRDAEAIARKIAYDRVRKKEYAFDPEMAELEEQLAESLGTRVAIEKKDIGGKIMIDFFTNDDLKKILDLVHSNEKKNVADMMDNFINNNNTINPVIASGSELQTESLEQRQIQKNENQNVIQNEKMDDETNFAPQNSSPDKTQSVSSLRGEAEAIQNRPSSLQSALGGETIHPTFEKVDGGQIQKNEIIIEKEDDNQDQTPKIISMGSDFQNNNSTENNLNNGMDFAPQNPSLRSSLGGEVIQERPVEQQQVQPQPQMQQIPVQQPQPEENKIKLDDDIEIIPNTNKREGEDNEENNTINPVPDFSQTEDEMKENKIEEHHEDNDDLYSLKDFTI